MLVIIISSVADLLLQK